MCVCVCVSQLCNCSLSLGMDRCFFEFLSDFLTPTSPAAAYKGGRWLSRQPVGEGSRVLTGRWNARRGGVFSRKWMAIESNPELFGWATSLAPGEKKKKKKD